MLVCVTLESNVSENQNNLIFGLLFRHTYTRRLKRPFERVWPLLDWTSYFVLFAEKSSSIAPIKRRPQKTSTSLPLQLPQKSSVFANRRRPHKYTEPFERVNGNSVPVPVTKKKLSPEQSFNTAIKAHDYDYYDDEDSRVVGNTKGQQVSRRSIFKKVTS